MRQATAGPGAQRQQGTRRPPGQRTWGRGVPGHQERQPGQRGPGQSLRKGASAQPSVVLPWALFTVLTQLGLCGHSEGPWAA